MKKQFLYSTILAVVLGFSIQNAYAAAAGPSVDAAPMEQQCRFSALRAAVYEYHPDFNRTTRDQSPEEKAINFTRLALQLLDLDKTILPRSLNLIEQYKPYFLLSFDQTFSVCEKMASRCEVNAAPWSLVSNWMAWTKFMNTLATTPEQTAIVHSCKERFLTYYAQSEGDEIARIIGFYRGDAALGNAESVVRLQEFLDNMPVGQDYKGASRYRSHIHRCFAKDVLSKGDADAALAQLHMARQQGEWDSLVLREAKLLATLLQVKPIETEVLVDELCASFYHKASLLLSLYKEYKQLAVARSIDPRTDRILGNLRFKMQESVLVSDEDVLGSFVEELKALGSEEFAAILCAQRYLKCSYDEKEKWRSKLVGAGEIGGRLASILLAIRDYSYLHFREEVEKSNLIALYGLRTLPLLQANRSSIHGVRYLKDTCKGYVEASYSEYTGARYARRDLSGCDATDIRAELATLAFWNTGDVDQIASEAGMLDAPGELRTGFSLDESALENALQRSLGRTIEATLTEVKANAEQSSYWLTETRRTMMLLGLGDIEMPEWLQHLERALEPTAGSGASSAAGAGASGSAAAAAPVVREYASESTPDWLIALRARMAGASTGEGGAASAAAGAGAGGSSAASAAAGAV